ncbi:MAG: Uma2 family endonuclease [Alphaproteobacteria bacterium]|nr:Uma2 family endonuclease [Alphaproteobacteria bacterium]
MERVTGSLGSEYVRFRLDPEAVLLLTEKFDWNLLARRVFIDSVTGFVELSKPSMAHERQARGMEGVMIAVARRGRPVAPLGSTRWRRPEDPTNTGAEPDACYYLGDRAERLDKIDPLDEDEDEHDAFALENPPDLVIEVERSSGDGDKPLAYRRLGVPEMWRIDISGNVREAVMLDLQAPDGPAELESSIVLPGATPAFVLEALALTIRRQFPELDALIAERLE